MDVGETQFTHFKLTSMLLCTLPNLVELVVKDCTESCYDCSVSCPQKQPLKKNSDSKKRKQYASGLILACVSAFKK